MRRVLVDQARARDAQKRGGAVERVEVGEFVDDRSERHDLVALDDALTALERVDARRAKVVELRYFGGLSVEETAEALQVSTDTVTRDWNRAKLWLLWELGNGPGPGEPDTNHEPRATTEGPTSRTSASGSTPPA